MTADTGTHAAAPNSWTACKSGGSARSLQEGTAAGNHDVDARERERKRNDCEERWCGARGLPTFRLNPKRWMREAQAAAAATEPQTAAHTSSLNAARAQTKGNTHTCETVGVCSIPTQESEGTRPPRPRPRPRPDGWIKHGREMPDNNKRRECTALQ
jgi:hypothetical protein